MSATCGTVHCAHREQLVAVLIKAALDAAVALDELKSGVIGVVRHADEDQHRHDKCSQIVGRVYDACEQFGVEVGVSEAKIPCKHVVIVADVCAICGAEVMP